MHCNIVLSGTSCKLCASGTCLYNVSRWTPKGQMIVHIHEHKESINRLVVTSFLSQSSLLMSTSLPSHNLPSLLTLLPSFSHSSLPSHNLPPFSQPPSLLTTSSLLTLLHPFHRSLSLHPLLPLLSSCLPLLFLVLFCIFKGHCQNSTVFVMIATSHFFVSSPPSFPTRIQVLQDSTIFATFSDDGTTKVWDVHKLEGRNLISRAKLSYSQQGSSNISMSKMYIII